MTIISEAGKFSRDYFINLNMKIGKTILCMPSKPYFLEESFLNFNIQRTNIKMLLAQTCCLDCIIVSSYHLTDTLNFMHANLIAWRACPQLQKYSLYLIC